MTALDGDVIFNGEVKMHHRQRRSPSGHTYTESSPPNSASPFTCGNQQENTSTATYAIKVLLTRPVEGPNTGCRAATDGELATAMSGHNTRWTKVAGFVATVSKSVILGCIWVPPTWLGRRIGHARLGSARAPRLRRVRKGL